MNRSLNIIVLVACSVVSLMSQLTVSNIIETQYGRLPNESVDLFPSVYNQLETDYKFKGLKANLAIEQYHAPFDGRSYTNLSKLSLSYKKKRWDIKIGNFYQTLDRGLVLRSFEMPGALLEDLGFRSRSAFHRDILGGSVKYKSKKLSVQLLRGAILNNVLPPVFNRRERRTDIVSALSAAYKYKKGHEAGITILRSECMNGSSDHFITTKLKGRITSSLNYYTEYAGNIEENRYALYSVLSGSMGDLGYSIEYKKYSDFVLGAGINEPPSGVKQQTYRVLNRSIHVTNPLNEEGYQIDLFYNLGQETILNFNHALALNRFGTRSTLFQQYFLEVQSSIGEGLDFKGFVDYSNDPFKDESNRFSIGLYTDIELDDKKRLLPELEYQIFERAESQIYNFNALLGLNISSRLFISILGEFTSDPFIVREGMSSRLYLGSTLRYVPSAQHTIQLFVGQRRGGPQCSAGVCYEILDFRGLELRWISRYSK